MTCHSRKGLMISKDEKENELQNYHDICKAGFIGTLEDYRTYLASFIDVDPTNNNGTLKLLPSGNDEYGELDTDLPF